jgi:hypothetical protein
METLSEIPADLFGAPPMDFSATQRLSSPLSRLSPSQDGRWNAVADLR